MSLKQRLLVSFLAIGLLPAAIICLVVVWGSTNTIKAQNFDHLTSVREMKSNQIQSYVESIERDLNMAMRSGAYMMDGSSSQSLTASAHGGEVYFKDFVESYGFYDLFIIDLNGDIVYTVGREADYQTNLNTGAYRSSGLAEAFKGAMNTKGIFAVDFKPYAPSNNDPAAFVAMPLEQQGKVTAIIALQLSTAKINALMQEREGMGKTGETYLVGSDFKMRSDSFLDPKNRNIVASFAGTVADNGAKTEATERALAGETATAMVLDYNNNPVLSAFTKVKVFNIEWLLLAEIDQAEVFIPIKQMQTSMLIIALIAFAAVLAVTYFVARSILHPLGGEPEHMHLISENIANGDLRMPANQAKDASGVYGAMHRMAKSLSDIMGQIVDASGKLSSSAEQTSAASEQTNISMREQQTSLATVASAMEEMTVSISEVATNVSEVADATETATKQSVLMNQKVNETVNVINTLANDVKSATTAISKVEKDSQEIGSILAVIQGIAEQTNLLALNAAIEAARAGEQGRGFAVVADEVRNLAQKTQESTQDIERMIEQLRQGTDIAVNAMKKGEDAAKTTISKARETEDVITVLNSEIDRINGRTAQIATAAEQQSYAADEINRNLIRIKDTAEENVRGAQHTSQASHELNALASNLKGITHRFQI